MADTTPTWDLFLAHAGTAAERAEELYELLAPHCRVFLDRRSLRPGDDLDLEIRRAQAASRVTVVLVSAGIEQAHYQREEIAAAVARARRAPSAHRVVPVYLDRAPTDPAEAPAGLTLKQGLVAPELGGLPGVATRLRALLAELTAPPAGPAAATTGGTGPTAQPRPSPTDPPRQRWLILGELAFPAGDAPEHDLVLGALVRSFLNGPLTELRPDLIVCCGSVTATGTPAAFQRAAAFFRELTRAVGLPPGRLVLLAGARDLDPGALLPGFRLGLQSRELHARFTAHLTEASWQETLRLLGGVLAREGPGRISRLLRHLVGRCNSGEGRDAMKGTTPVGSYRGGHGPYGLWDQAGNVRVWCRDWKGPYDPNAVDDPTGPATRESRVYRGGGWSFRRRWLRVCSRGDGLPLARGDDLGFRCVAAPPPRTLDC